jgi:hypothetical protein
MTLRADDAFASTMREWHPLFGWAGDRRSVENAGIQRVVRSGLCNRKDDVVPVAPEITDGLVRQERAIPVNDEAEIPTASMLDLDVVSIDHDSNGSRSIWARAVALAA